MKRALITLSLAAALALAGCNRAETPKVDEAQKVAAAAASGAGGPCAVNLDTPWAPVDGVVLTATASAAGATCPGAVATLLIKDAAGAELVKFEAPLTQMPVIFTGTADAAALRTELGQWLDQNEDLNTTGKLPEWKAGAASPMAGEFPFYPEEGVTRDIYQSQRAKDAPMFCFVQGAESQACFMFDAATSKMTRLGVQSFPG